MKKKELTEMKKGIVGSQLMLTRVSSGQVLPNTKLDCSQTLADMLRTIWPPDLDVRERFIIIAANNANYPLSYYELSSGGIAATIVEISFLLAFAALSGSKKIIVAHNHPSGRLNPSNEDIKITKKIDAALQHIDIKILDHIILVPNEGEYYSFADNGLI